VSSAPALDFDAQLMLRVREGDEECFRALLERHRNSLVGYLYRMIQDSGRAEDLAQDVFLRIYKSRASYEPTARFTTWMFRIATHVALNWLRNEKNTRRQESLDVRSEPGEARLELPDRRPSVEQSLLDEVRLNEVRMAIGSLPEKQRAAVLMHKYEGMDYAQIAGVFDCSESAVKSLLFRAYESLRAKLAHLVRGEV